jgi:hypothetical protein
MQAQAIDKCKEASVIPNFAASWPLTRQEGSPFHSLFKLNKNSAAYKQAGLKAPEGIDYSLTVWLHFGTIPLEWTVELQNLKVANDAPDRKQFIYTIHFGPFEKSWYLSGLSLCKIALSDDAKKIDHDKFTPTADLTQYNI